MTTILSIENIHKTFEAGTVNENHVLRGLSIDVKKETLSLLSVVMVLVSQHL